MQNPHSRDRLIRAIAIHVPNPQPRSGAPPPSSVSLTPSDPEAEYQRRLAAVDARLRALSQQRLEGRTDPDPATGERWEAGEMWAHLAEFIPYWIGEAERVLAEDSGDPVPFGRARANPERVAAIERDRHRGTTALWHDVREDLSDLRAFLGDITERGWRVRGLHPTQGVMPVSQIVEEMLIGHLEEHAGQLERMRRG